METTEDIHPYDMTPADCQYTGQCLVFNNVRFTPEQFGTRTGSVRDYTMINSVFSRFGFRVEEKRDCSASNMMDTLRHTAKAYPDHYRAFVCFFLSHGKGDQMIDRDGRLVDMNTLINMFMDYCPQMTGKPKLFFVQMCRSKASEGEDTETATAGASCDSAIGIQPTSPDVLLSFATTSGRKAYRSDDTGSPFIRQLTRVLKARGHIDSLFEVLKVTGKRVEETVAMENKDMCPSYVSTLTRPLVFNQCVPNVPHVVTQETQDEEEQAPSLCCLRVALR